MTTLERLANPPHSGVERDPSLIVLVGVSGAGKDTLIKAAVSRRRLRKPISATTRPPRADERDGVDYHFFTAEEFRRRAEAGEMFEWAEFNGQLYGTLRAELEEPGLKIAIRENQGARDLKERLGALVVGVFPPDDEAVRERLVGRGDDARDVERRLAIDHARAEEILGFADYRLINDDLDEATAALLELLDELDPAA